MQKQETVIKSYCSLYTHQLLTPFQTTGLISTYGILTICPQFSALLDHHAISPELLELSNLITVTFPLLTVGIKVRKGWYRVFIKRDLKSYKYCGETREVKSHDYMKSLCFECPLNAFRMPFKHKYGKREVTFLAEKAILRLTEAMDNHMQLLRVLENPPVWFGVG